MKLKVLDKLFLALLVFGVCMRIQAQSMDLSPVANLAYLLAETDSMTANFDQLTLDQEGREVQESQGVFIIRKPDHLFSHAIQPSEAFWATNGVKVWNYDLDMEQVTIEPFVSDHNNPLMLLSANAETLSSLYEITQYEGDNGEWHFVLMPQRSDSKFYELSLSFDGIILTELYFEDTVGQNTFISFDNIEINIEIPNETFELVPPDGVDIIDSTL